MKTKLLILLLLVLPLLVQGQKEDFVPPTIVPPSPTAFELGSYGYANVGLHTGTASSSIPIYNYTAGKLSVPISLSYSSNGIKVDKLSSNVGLGWSLNAGGVITRIVMGKSDENNALLWPEEEIEQNGVWSPMAMNFFYAIGNGDDIDAQPDQYAYNFNGYTGKFAYTKEHDLILMPHKDIKIESYVEGTNTGFMATTADGIRYIFLDQEINMNRTSASGHSVPGDPSTTAWYLTRIIHPSGDQIDFTYSSPGYSYYVGISESLRIASPPLQQKDCNNWTSATDYAIDSVKNKLSIAGKQLIKIEGTADSDGQVDISYSLSHPEISAYDLVTQIKVTDHWSNTIEKVDLDYLTTNNDRVFLTEVQFNDPERKYSLEYIDPSNFPIRLNYGQDHWGYYNGKTNTYKFPNPDLMDDYNIHADFRRFNIGADREIDSVYAQKGLLKKITYPTTGYTEITYESNSYYGERTVYPSPTTSYLSVNTDDDLSSAPSIDTFNVTNIQADQEVEFYSSIGFNDYESGCDISGYPTHHILATIKVTNTTTSQTNTIYHRNGPLGNSAKGNSINITPEDLKSDYYFDFKANSNYEIELKINWTCLTSAMSLSYFQGTIQKVDDNISLGGLRVQKVSIYDPISAKTGTKRYYYNDKETLNESSGDPGIMPFYVSDAETQYLCGIINGTATYNTTYKHLNSSSTRSLSNPASGTVSYEYVTVSHGGDDFENGGEEHKFTMGYDFNGNPLIGNYIQSAPWTNAGWDNGLEKRQVIFKKDATGNNFVHVKETINEYNDDSRIYNAIKGYAVNKKYTILNSGPIYYQCTSDDFNFSSSYSKCQTNHEHNYWFGWCYAQNHDNKRITVYHPCENANLNAGDTLTMFDQISNLDITAYETRSYWYNLDSTIVKEYDLDGLNPIATTTKYYYDNEDHIQLSRTNVTNSNGEVVETKLYYPDDVSSISDLLGGNITGDNLKAIDSLKFHHRINIPIQKEQINDGSVFRSRTIFKDWGQKDGSVEHLIEPAHISSAKESETLVERLTFNYYDEFGNLKDVSKKDGPNTYYVWGYNNSLPIAKIENPGTITTPQLTLISDAEDESDSDDSETDEDTLRTYLDSLRTGFPNSLVTTYTYDPLVGVTSVTDPKGMTTYYVYDDYGRLLYVKDQYSNILSKNEYHYKSQ